jgi:hypothetical protein
MTELFTEINLWNNEGRHDKVYNIYLYKTPLTEHWTVEATYGKRGATLVKVTKAENVNQYTAQKVFEGLKYEKMKKGYNTFSQHVQWAKPASNKVSFFNNYVTQLLGSSLFNPQEYQRIKGLMSSDDESFNLAVGIITTKELQWAQK